MNDMSSVIVPKSDQINADDFIAGPQTITITDVQIKGGQEQPVSIYFDGSDKAFRPCKSMSRVLVHAWGPDAKVYVGRSLTLYRDPSVKWGGLEVGGIRISHMSHIDGKLQMQLTATKGQRRPHVVLPLAAPAPKADAANAASLIAEINACADKPTLVKWWKANGETIADADYDRVLGVFNERLAAMKSAPQTATGDGSAESGPANKEGEVAALSEGRDDSQMGEKPTLDQAKAEIDAAELVADVNSRVTAFEGQLSDEDMDALRSHAMGRIEALS